MKNLDLLHRTLRLSILFSTAVAVLMADAQSSRAVAEERPPNIVLIMADDMGFECVGANGGTSYRTPELDRLAAASMRFVNAHSQPICTPSRVQIMTGIYNHRNYVRFGLLDPDVNTFGHLFRNAGYRTCVVGKWQLEGGFEGPGHFGFDEYCLWQLTRRPARYTNPGLEVNGAEADYRDGEFGPDIVSDYLCDFMERNRDRSFFAYYPMILPHYPFVPTPGSPDYDPTMRGEKGIGDPKYFDGMVEYVDKIVGKVVAKLDALGLRDRTLIVFTGDNGTHPRVVSRMGTRAYRGGKGSTRDNGTHVPFIANWPGKIPAGKVNPALIDFSDILPTLADVAGIAVPAAPTLDGRSQAAVFRGESVAARDWIYCWYDRNGNREQAKELVRNARFKLYGDGSFYDVIADFGEKQPLNPTDLPPDVRAVHARLETELRRKMAITDAHDPIQEEKREKDRARRAQSSKKQE